MRKKRIDQVICSLEGCIDMKKIDVLQYFQELQELGKKIVLKKNFKPILDFCTGLANEDRLKIVEILKEKDRCVCELEAILNKSQPSISHHLRILESANLIKSFKKGKFTHYELNNDQFKRDIRKLVHNFMSIQNVII